MGLTTPSCKKQLVTETSTIENASGDRGDAGQPHDGSLTVASKSRKEADSPTADTLKPNKKSRIGTWNVRTLYQTGKLSQVVKEFDNYRLDLWDYVKHDGLEVTRSLSNLVILLFILGGGMIFMNKVLAF